MVNTGRKRKAPSDLPSESKKRVGKRLSCNVDNCFLLELSDPESHYVKNFNDIKYELADYLYSFYNETIFENQLPQRMYIKWNKRVSRIAGLCRQAVDSNVNDYRYSEIHLGEKLVDSADRLCEILIHEMCHAAAWLIDGVPEGHGQPWRYYTRKAMTIHPELPPITKDYDYELHYKYIYECRSCQTRYGRFTKSINTRTKSCGNCEGKLFLRKN